MGVCKRFDLSILWALSSGDSERFPRPWQSFLLTSSTIWPNPLCIDVVRIAQSKLSILWILASLQNFFNFSRSNFSFEFAILQIIFVFWRIFLKASKSSSDAFSINSKTSSLLSGWKNARAALPLSEKWTIQGWITCEKSMYLFLIGLFTKLSQKIVT